MLKDTYVSYKHINKFTADLKHVYRTLSEEAAMEKLIEFKDAVSCGTEHHEEMDAAI